MTSARPPAASILTAQFTFDLELVILTVFLLSLVVAGIVVVIRVKRWRSAPDEPLVPRIDQYRALLEKGIIAQEEFERIRKHLEQGTGAPDATPQDASPQLHTQQEKNEP